MNRNPALRNRLLIAAILIPALVLCAWLGGWVWTGFVAVIAILAALEFWQLFHNGKFSPSMVLMAIFIVAAIVLRQAAGFKFADLWLALLIGCAMLLHLFGQQNGTQEAAVDFAVTVSGTVYLGWLAAYAISLRTIEQGFFWLLLVAGIILLADTGAYAVGIRFGKHKMLPKVSPNKSWEGYFGGIVTGILAGWGIAAIWHSFIPLILPWHGLLLGAVISILAPMGDFGESMLKRQFAAKDSGKILGAHGGFLDRIDSILWALPIGWYLVQVLLHLP